MLAGTLESPCSAEELAGSIDSLYPIPKSQKAVPHIDPLGESLGLVFLVCIHVFFVFAQVTFIKKIDSPK